MNQRINSGLGRHAGWLCGLASLVLATGCAATAPGFDANFGQSVRAAVAAQTINPGAVHNNNPVVGLDGAAAVAAQRKYEASFAAPAQSDPGMMAGGKR